MDDLISRAAARDVINTWGWIPDKNVRMKQLREDIFDLPTVDAAPVAHGRWTVTFENFTPELVCSVCRVKFPCVAGCCIETKLKYCPNCGAKMDKEEYDG